LLNIPTYAFHENLGIDDNKASELYKTNPNDPAIMQWKNALQSEINDIGDDCFDIRTAFLCEHSMSIITANCVLHPNTLLACNDSRFPHYPLILNQSKEAHNKAVEAQRKVDEAQRKAEQELHKQDHAIQMQTYGKNMVDTCFISIVNASSKYEVANPACDLEMRSLQGECQLANNTYDYCKDERFMGFLTKHDLLNSSAVK